MKKKRSSIEQSMDPTNPIDELVQPGFTVASWASSGAAAVRRYGYLASSASAQAHP